ncbi:MAG TPA: AmmeMemoRadiSam system radical SAM enzyme [Haloplasmataceae bacterium]
MIEASFWEVYDDKSLKCKLCPHYCIIPESKHGRCLTRKNINQRLVLTNYGKVSSIALDPIEKKPLFHFFPGKMILSLGSFGCNMKCSYCQNYSISQKIAPTEDIDISYIVRLLEKLDDNIGIAFTYNEPFMWYEFIYDVVRSVKDKLPHKKVVLVTNGYVNQEPLEKLLPYIDSMNIDLKSFEDTFYQKICKASMKPVLDTIKMAYNKCHIEVTTLMVTNLNDSLCNIELIAKFLSDLDKNIPLHLTRYFPNYLLSNAPTSITLMGEAKKVAQKYLNYVYLGNVPTEDFNIYCPKCKSLVYNRIQRKSYLRDDLCPQCNFWIPLINK